MRLRQSLMTTFNFVLSMSSAFLSTQIFFNSKISNKMLDAFITELKSSEVVFFSSYINEQSVKLAIYVVIIILTLYNFWLGGSRYIKNTYYLSFLILFPEIFSHSQLDWVNVIFGWDVYDPSTSFIQLLFVCLLICGGYFLSYFDGYFREINSAFLRRGVSEEEADHVYSNQSIISLTTIVLSFFIVIIISFMVELVVDPLYLYLNLNNINYVFFGFVSSLILGSALYVFLREYNKKS